MGPLLKEVRGKPILWLLTFVPTVLIAAKVASHAHRECCHARLFTFVR